MGEIPNGVYSWDESLIEGFQFCGYMSLCQQIINRKVDEFENFLGNVLESALLRLSVVPCTQNKKQMSCLLVFSCLHGSLGKGGHMDEWGPLQRWDQLGIRKSGIPGLEASRVNFQGTYIAENQSCWRKRVQADKMAKRQISKVRNTETARQKSQHKA